MSAAGEGSGLGRIARLPARIVRHLFLDRSYQGYYTPESWDASYRDGYDLDTTKEDGRYGTLLALVERYGTSDAPLLDAGCGDGVLARHLRKVTDAPIVGIDYSEEAIRIARATHVPDTTYEATDFRHFVTDVRFSMIIFNEALYYVDAYLEALEALERFLTTEGVFVISMFDTAVTARIWKRVMTRYDQLQGVRIRDERTGQSWRVRVVRPRSS